MQLADRLRNIAVDPGLVKVNVCTESLRVVDVRIQIIAIGEFRSAPEMAQLLK
jgi:hypothetical protein